jgi:hypothetical protein
MQGMPGMPKLIWMKAASAQTACSAQTTPHPSHLFGLTIGRRVLKDETIQHKKGRVKVQ